MRPTDFHLPTRIAFGPGRIDELGTHAKSLDAKRALVVSDPGIVDAGHTARAIRSLAEAGVKSQLFDGVHENPTTAHVDIGLAVAHEFKPDLIVGLGGGSSMDCAKGINFIYSCGGKMHDYWGTGKATGPLLPMIAIPTTAGTGSETQSYALISDADTHVKMACGDKRAAFAVAILDPELTLTQPARVTALTGIDAIAHAIETFVTKPRNWISQAFSRESWRRLLTSFPRVLAEPDNLDARAGMQIGACLAGLAIENSMLGSAHALANPITASYGTAHGEAVGVMLPHVIAFNGRQVAGLYDALYGEVSSGRVGEKTVDTAGGLAQFVEDVRQQAGLAGTLTQCGVERDRLPQLAAAATQQWTGKFNPVEMTHDDFLHVYEAAF
jgi:alcohol dehydrogenase